MDNLSEIIGSTHLHFIYNRMKDVHGENENFDYMLNLKNVIEMLERQEENFRGYMAFLEKKRKEKKNNEDE